MVGQEQTHGQVSGGRDPRAGNILRLMFARAARKNSPQYHEIPTPIVYESEADFPAVRAAYADPRNIEKNINLVFLAPAVKMQTSERKNQCWADMLATVNRDFSMAVLVENPDVACRLAARLRNTGPGLAHMRLKKEVGDYGQELAPLDDLRSIAQIQKPQAGWQ